MNHGTKTAIVHIAVNTRELGNQSAYRTATDIIMALGVQTRMQNTHRTDREIRLRKLTIIAPQ